MPENPQLGKDRIFFVVRELVDGRGARSAEAMVDDASEGAACLDWAFSNWYFV
jgi:hypothetical protein